MPTGSPWRARSLGYAATCQPGSTAPGLSGYQHPGVGLRSPEKRSAQLRSSSRISGARTSREDAGSSDEKLK